MEEVILSHPFPRKTNRGKQVGYNCFFVVVNHGKIMKPKRPSKNSANRPHGAPEHHTGDTNKRTKTNKKTTNTQALSDSKNHDWVVEGFNTHWPRAVALARRRGVSDPESVATDSFLDAGLGFELPLGSFKKRYYFLLRKRIYRVLRAELRFTAIPVSNACSAVLSQLTVDPPDPAIKDTIEKMLGELEPIDRYALVGKFCYGKSGEEMAMELGCCSGSIRSRVSRALKFLRARFRITVPAARNSKSKATPRKPAPKRCRKKVPQIGPTPPLPFSSNHCNEIRSHLHLISEGQ